MKYILKLVLILFPLVLWQGISLNWNEGKFLAEAFSENNERDVFETLDQEKEKDSFLPTTPMELMQTLQKSSAMDNATSPTDAIDDALKIFQENALEEQNTSINN